MNFWEKLTKYIAGEPINKRADEVQVTPPVNDVLLQALINNEEITR